MYENVYTDVFTSQCQKMWNTTEAVIYSALLKTAGGTPEQS